jgi:hypothetical protein
MSRSVWTVVWRAPKTEHFSEGYAGEVLGASDIGALGDTDGGALGADANAPPE